jgi:hypothetical protein
MKTLVSQIMAITPWGLLGNLGLPLGIIGIAVQLSGLVFMVWLGVTGQWGE